MSTARTEDSRAGLPCSPPHRARDEHVVHGRPLPYQDRPERRRSRRGQGLRPRRAMRNQAHRVLA